MQIIRTIVWVFLLVALILFSAINWDDVKVVLWPNSDPAQTIVADTKIPVLVIISFAIGFVPMWLYHRAAKWSMQRKIASLENAARTAASTPVAAAAPPEAEAASEPAPEPAPIQEPTPPPPPADDPDSPLRPTEDDDSGKP